MKLQTVKLLYKLLNRHNFGNVLEMPILKFTRSSRHDGHWDDHSRVMAFNLADTKGLASAKELIFHEMIHQYIDEFLQIEIADDHGKEFKKQYNKFSSGINMDKDYSYGTIN